MDKNTGIGTGLVDTLNEMVKRGNLASNLRQLLELNDAQLRAIMPPILSLIRFVEGQDVREDNNDNRRWVAGLFASLIGMINDGDMSWRQLQALEDIQSKQRNAVSYLPEPFRAFQQVGAIILMAMISCRRLAYDLPQIAIRWRESLGNPVLPDVEFLQRNPFMMPVAFCAGKWMHHVAKNPRQYYGLQPALRQGCSPNHLNASSDKWPMEDIYAFCPVPSSSADDAGKAFWFEHCTWPEQQAELKRLQRRYPRMTVRFARLHELAFLDLSLRLATWGSPMGIYNFRCENPVEGANCLTYGGVDGPGAQIKEEGDSTKHEHRVLPLFILKGEKTKK